VSAFSKPSKENTTVGGTKQRIRTIHARGVKKKGRRKGEEEVEINFAKRGEKVGYRAEKVESTNR
jgi:hypothetical protein